MDEKILSSFQWFGKIDTDGIPLVLFVNREAFIRCRCCKVHKTPCDTLIVAKHPTRLCKDCKSKSTMRSQYENKGKERKRSKLVIRFCADCNKPTKSRNWQPRHNCCKECFQARRHAKKTLPECRYCGQPVKGKKRTFCSVKCMADSKKKRHQVSCIQCQNPMEIVENRFKARSFFLCSTKCASDFYFKQRQATAEKNNRKRIKKREEREAAKANAIPDCIWTKKAKQESLKVFFVSAKSEWERKSITAAATMRKRVSIVVYQPGIIVDWVYWINQCRVKLTTRDRKHLRSDWERKCETSSSNLKKRLRQNELV